jgi:hypothetical protein
MATLKKAQTGRKFSDIYTGPAKTNPGVLKAKADKAKADSSISDYKKNAKKVFKTATDSAKARLLRVPKQKNGGSTPAWQRKEGKNPSGGLNAKGRASYNRANPGKPGLKAPQPEGGSRKKSFCARMSGMKKKLTSSKTANDPNSRINKSLRKWKC